MKCKYCGRKLVDKSLTLRDGCKWCNVEYRRRIDNKKRYRTKSKSMLKKIVGIINNFHVEEDENIAIERIKKVLRGEQNAKKNKKKM